MVVGVFLLQGNEGETMITFYGQIQEVDEGMSLANI